MGRSTRGAQSITITLKMKLMVLSLVLLLVVNHTMAGIVGLATYGVCQTGCNTAWVACVAAAGGVAGVSTGGAAVPAAILACNVAQGACMAACAGMALSPV